MERWSLSRWMASACALILCSLALGCGVSNTPAPPEVAVAATQNPLVAQLTISSSCFGQAMVEFGPDTSYGRSTSWYPINGHFVANSILVAGMKASTTYHM